MSSIKETCSSRTHPRLHYGGLFLKNISHQHITAPLQIKLRLTSKNFKNFINTPSLGVLFMGLGLGPNPLLDQTKFQFGCKQLSPGIHYGPRVIFYVLKPKTILLGLFPIMRPKIQFSVYDVEFQRQKRVKSNLIRKQMLVP